MARAIRPRRPHLSAGDGRRSAITRERIVEVASEVFRQHGFHGAALADIAQRLGVTKPALYHHIRSKEELLFGMQLRLVDLALGRINAIIESGLPVADRLAAVLEAHMLTVVEYLPLFAVFFQERRQLSEPHRRRVDAARRQYNDLVERVYQEGVAAGVYRPLEPKIAVFSLLGMASTLYQWYRPGGRLSAGQIAQVVCQLASRGYLACDQVAQAARNGGRSM